MSGIINFDDYETAACEQGSTFSRIFEWTEKNGTPIDFNLFTAKMQIRKNIGKEIIQELSTENGGLFYDSNNELNMLISSEDTSAIPAGNYIYDLELTEIETGIVYRFLKGKFKVTPEVTL